MIIDLNFITDDWKREAIAEAVVAKAQALILWSKKKEAEIEEDLTAELEKDSGASGVDSNNDSAAMDRLCSKLERQRATTEQLVQIAAKLAGDFKQVFGESQKKPNQKAVLNRAKALLNK